MSLLWWIGLKVRNAGLVDFGWPSGFTAIALFYASTGEGSWQRKAILVSMICLCGVRFILGWVVRNTRDGEDRRWQLWRERWQSGNGLFAIRSVGVNLFAFYQAQAFVTAIVLTAPLAIACQNRDTLMHRFEWIAVGVWGTSFLLQNMVEFQLDQFRRRPKGAEGVCRVGLWNYSRHPNYFFEFLIWLSYAIFALPSAVGLIDYVLLLLVPVLIYWFLVYFTGIPITELASLRRRGEPYARYQAETNQFFPWFPKQRHR